MQQWVLKGTGSVDNLHLEEAPVPEVGDYEVLVNSESRSPRPSLIAPSLTRSDRLVHRSRMEVIILTID